MTTLTRRRFGASLAVLASPLAAPAAHAQGRPLYKDPKTPIPARVDDLLGRMTLEEKVAQMVGIWLNKEQIQTAEAEFSPEAASKFRSRAPPTATPHGLAPSPAPNPGRSTARPPRLPATSTPPRNGRWRRPAWGSRC
jgi:hypothetical protein